MAVQNKLDEEAADNEEAEEGEEAETETTGYHH